MKLTDEERLNWLKKFKPCPFCGCNLHYNLDDSYYPSGSWYRETKDGIQFLLGKERLPTDKPVLKVTCPETSGGCGASLYGLTPEEVLSKWNRRQKENK